MIIRTVIFIGISLILTACNSSNEIEMPEKVEYSFTINSENHGWSVGFADYPVGEEEFYELGSEFGALPEPLNQQSGLMVRGNNHSDDLFMFIKKSWQGFKPNTLYDIEFELTIATNVPKNCVGVGGSPGEGVTVKAGLSITEPKPVANGNNFYVMNIDKGNQTVGGSDALVVGDMANSKDCNAGDDFIYETKTMNSNGTPFSVRTDSNGVLWLLFGTDSGFESTTQLYFLSGRVVASEV